MNAVLLVFAPLVVAYAATAIWCVERWNAESGYFAHCWLVPVVAALVLWQRRIDWAARPAATDRRGLWLLFAGLSLHLVGAALTVDSWSAASLALAVPGACWWAFGRARLHGLWPVVWLVLFAIPAPIYVEGRLAFVLKEVAVNGGAWLANLLGADVVRTADSLRPNGLEGSLYVADACGGLRSLLAMMTIAYCLAFFTGPAAFGRRLAILLAAAPLAVAANVTRIAVLCLFARWFGVPFAEGTGHTLANIAEWGALVAALLAVDLLALRRFVGAGDVATRPSIDWTPASTLRRGSLVRVGVVLWVLAGPLLWLSVYRPHGERADRADRLPLAIEGYELQPRSPELEARFRKNLPQWRELLGTDDFVWRFYRDSRGALVRVVALFHDSNWKSVHPPRICVEGSNMTIENDDLVPIPQLGDEVSVGRIVAKDRGSSWRWVTLSVYGTATWASGDYWDFALHHLPLALFRRNDSGFLLRVESPIYSGEDAGVAESRCAAFLGRIVPQARELLR